MKMFFCEICQDNEYDSFKNAFILNLIQVFAKLFDTDQRCSQPDPQSPVLAPNDLRLVNLISSSQNTPQLLDKIATTKNAFSSSFSFLRWFGSFFLMLILMMIFDTDSDLDSRMAP